MGRFSRVFNATKYWGLSRLFSTEAVKSISICSGGGKTVPGAIPLTCTSGDKARAKPFVNEIKAAFEAQYGRKLFHGRSVETSTILMIFPSPQDFITSPTACDKKKGAFKLSMLSV